MSSKKNANGNTLMNIKVGNVFRAIFGFVVKPNKYYI